MRNIVVYCFILLGISFCTSCTEVDDLDILPIEATDSLPTNGNNQEDDCKGNCN